MQLDPDSREREVQRSLGDSIAAGAYTAVMLGVGENYLGAYGIFLGAGAFETSLLTTLPPLVGSLMVLTVLDRIIGISDRSHYLERVTVLQSIIWIPVACLSFVFGVSGVGVWFLLACAIAHYSLSALSAPTWNGLMGDLVPPASRGSYFGRRNKITLLVSLVSMVLSGFILQWAAVNSCTRWGYLVLFLCSFTARFRSAFLYGAHYEPGNNVTAGDYFSFSDFLKRSHRSNFLKFTLFVGAFNLSVFVSNPFITYYLLTALKMSYVEYTAIISAVVVSQMLMVERWGVILDEFGAKKVLILSCIGYALVDFCWLLSSDFWVILISRIVAGALWAGFQLSSVSFLFDAVSPPKRARCNAYQAVINSVCIILGTLLGGMLVACIPSSVGLPAYLTGSNSSILVLFLVSGSMRLLVLFLLVAFAEVRDVPEIKPGPFIFRVMHLNAIMGPVFRVIPRGTGRDNSGKG